MSAKKPPIRLADFNALGRDEQRYALSPGDLIDLTGSGDWAEPIALACGFTFKDFPQNLDCFGGANVWFMGRVRVNPWEALFERHATKIGETIAISVFDATSSGPFNGFAPARIIAQLRLLHADGKTEIKSIRLGGEPIQVCPTTGIEMACAWIKGYVDQVRAGTLLSGASPQAEPSPSP